MQPAKSEREENIRLVIEKKLASLGLELYDLKCIAAGSRLIVRVFIDKEGAVTVDDCAQVSHALSVLLDVENFSQRPYTLEVSSPGIDRVMTSEKEFRRAVGKKVRVHFSDADNKNRSVSGALTACSADTITLETKEGTRIIPLRPGIKGKIEISF